MGSYLYDALNRRASRTAQGTTVHYVHDLEGRLLAELDGGTGATLREYVWLEEELLAVIEAGGASPVTYYAHVDHIGRPVMLTDAAKAVVWEAVWQPFGEAHQVSGTASLALRYPGQWLELETGLFNNWHRHYDPSTGRYLQPDPLGMPDGPSRWAYAKSSPLMYTDPDGRNPLAAIAVRVAVGAVAGLIADMAYQWWEHDGQTACISLPPASGRGAITGAMVTLIWRAPAFRKFLANESGAGPKRLGPDRNAVGPHSTWKTDRNGNITRHETGEPNPRNPNIWESRQSTDMVGRPHANSKTGQDVPTPHTQGKGIGGGVRPAEPHEIPKGTYNW